MRMLMLVLALTSPAFGQTAAKKTPEQLQALFEQHRGDFDGPARTLPQLVSSVRSRSVRL